MEVIERGTFYFLQVNYYLTALLPMPSIPLAPAAVRIGWLLYLFGVMFLLFSWRINGGDTSISGLVGTMLFIINDAANIVVILEAYFKYPKYLKLCRLQRELDDFLEHQLQWRLQQQLKRARIMLHTFQIVLLLCVCDGLRVWINERTNRQLSPVFYYAFPIILALRWRCIQIIVFVMQHNARVELLKRFLKRLVRLNRPKHKYSTDIWQAYTSYEYDSVNAMRLVYAQLHELFLCINDCFGWSILLIFLTTLFDFVCNSYWTYRALYNDHRDLCATEKHVLNGATICSLGTLVSVLFFCTNASTNNSRFIGCFICQLAKPLGNKHYNDLVTEFSLQTLQQQFTITAKDFFQLDLNVFGSMVAAIMTYLVVLIQFMLTEKFPEVNLITNLTTILLGPGETL